MDNKVEERHDDGLVVERFQPVSASGTPQAMEELHAGFARAMQENRYSPLLLSAAYVLDFLVIHPFRDGNGRMARLISLWLLYIAGHEVGRFISVEKLIEESKETYYEPLQRSTAGWHEDEHDLRSSLSAEFTVAEIRDAAPGVSDAYISKVLGELKAAGAIERLSRGRGARWRRLQHDLE